MGTGVIIISAQNSKEYLKSIRTLDIDTKVKNDTIAVLEENLKRINPQTTNERVMNSNSSDVTKTVDKIIDLQSEIRQEIDRLIVLKKEAINIIEQIQNKKYITVLTEYYINCKTWEEVAKIVPCDDRYVYKLHIKALQAFDKIFGIGH
jgi:hypothetical protein